MQLCQLALVCVSMLLLVVCLLASWSWSSLSHHPNRGYRPCAFDTACLASVAYVAGRMCCFHEAFLHVLASLVEASCAACCGARQQSPLVSLPGPRRPCIKTAHMVKFVVENYVAKKPCFLSSRIANQVSHTELHRVPGGCA